jgi:hypothetical protein
LCRRDYAFPHRPADDAPVAELFDIVIALKCHHGIADGDPFDPEIGQMRPRPESESAELFT